MKNIPETTDLAMEVGKRLFEELLEPLNATFGRVAVRSAYRSPSVNACGNENGHGCASNEGNYAGHIWDRLDSDGKKGATAFIVIPWFADRFADGADWRALAYWIHNHLPYGDLYFHPKLCAFNIRWHEKPSRTIRSYIKPASELVDGEPANLTVTCVYAGFPMY